MRPNDKVRLGRLAKRLGTTPTALLRSLAQALIQGVAVEDDQPAPATLTGGE